MSLDQEKIVAHTSIVKKLKNDNLNLAKNFNAATPINGKGKGTGKGKGQKQANKQAQNGKVKED